MTKKNVIRVILIVIAIAIFDSILVGIYLLYKNNYNKSLYVVTKNNETEEINYYELNYRGNRKDTEEFDFLDVNALYLKKCYDSYEEKIVGHQHCKVFDESGRERTQLSFGEFKGTLSDNIASMDNSINDLARNNQGLPVDQDGQTYIASPLLVKQTEQTYIKFAPLDTTTHTNTYTATIGANPTTPSLTDDEYFYIKIKYNTHDDEVYFKFFPSNQIHLGSTHWDDIILTRDNAKALRNSTDLDYTGTVRWCTDPLAIGYFPKGTWTQIGSITVGNKTIYAYEKTSQ